VEVSATGRSLVEGSPTEYVCVRVCMYVCVALSVTRGNLNLHTYNELAERGQEEEEEEEEEEKEEEEEEGRRRKTKKIRM